MLKSRIIMKNKNLYEILGLTPEASRDDIKIAYRKLVRIYHPDVNKTKEAEIYFKMLNNAVETLLDDTKRLQYDVMAGLSGAEKGRVQNESPVGEENLKTGKNFESKKPGQNMQGQAFEPDLTRKNTFNSVFSRNENSKNLGSGSIDADKTAKTKAQSPKLDGKDIETVVKISKDEQKRGTIRKINVLHTDKCPKCLGRKYFNGTVCSLCRGEGEKSEHKVMSVKIPARIKHGTKMKIKNEGEYGKFGGKNGDLYLLIEIGEEFAGKTGEFDTVKNTIEASISPALAVFGGDAEITVSGKTVKIKIPPLTKSMTRFKLDKETSKALSNGQNAEYTVVIKIDISENLSQKELDLYKKLREIELG